jgi:hypothetical protein
MTKKRSAEGRAEAGLHIGERLRGCVQRESEADFVGPCEGRAGLICLLCVLQMLGQQLEYFIHELFQLLLVAFLSCLIAQLLQSRLINKHSTLSPFDCFSGILRWFAWIEVTGSSCRCQ